MVTNPPTSQRRFRQVRRWALISVVVFSAGVLLLSTPVLAQLTNNGGLTELQGSVALGNRPLILTIGSIINVVLGFLGVIALGLILYAGFLWMTSRGNEEQIAKAKRILASAAIGLAIILASFALASFIVQRLSNATGVGTTGGGLCSDGLPPPCPTLGSFRVQSVSPGNASTGAALCKRVQGVFSDTLDASTVNSGTVVVTDTNNTTTTTDDTTVVGTYTTVGSGFSMAHAAEFQPGRRYNADIVSGGSGVKSALGDTLRRDYTWYFTTGTTSDTTAPTVATVSPSSGATNVCLAAPIQVIFSEEMDVTTFTAANIQVTAGGAPVTIGRIVPGSDFKSVTIIPASQLPANTSVTVTLKTGITDSCGNGLASDYTWSFQTGVNTDCTPKLNSVTPGSGYYGDTLVLSGANFGIKHDVLFNGSAADSLSFTPPTDNIISWNDTTIQVRAPVGAPVPPNPMQVVVDRGDRVSNALDFTLQSPYISWLSPGAGPEGQFVTLHGGNFGTSPGTVRFISVATGTPTDAALACSATTSWGDTQVVVRVPAGIGAGAYNVELTTTAPAWRSNQERFTVNTDPLAPGLCSVVPACTQLGANPTLATLTGERFGASQGTSRVRLGSNLNSSVTSWNDTTIQNAGFSASYVDGRYGAQVVVGGLASNSLNFNIPCTGGPAVVESNSCTVASQSPSPYKDTIDACSNASVSARFTVAMDPATFTYTGASPNIVVQRCNTGVSSSFSAAACTTALTFASLQPIAGFGGAAGFTLTGASPALAANTWYQATITTGVTNASGTQALRAPYAWHWQVSGTACTPAAVQVSPGSAYLRTLDPNPGSTQDFSASASAANCNVLDPTSYAWSWGMTNNMSSGTPWTDISAQNLNQATARAISYMPDATSPAQLTATAAGKSDSASVYATATGCTSSIDCVVAGCSLGTSSCVAGQCTPAITGFSPADGAAGTWVSINGCFFGTARGRVTYQPAVDGLWPSTAVCPANTWTNTQIVSEVPPGAATGPLTVVRPSTPPASATSTASFTANSVNHPGLCQVSPGAVYQSQLGTPAAQVTLRGRGFSDTQGAGTATFFDAAPAVTGSASTYASWSDIAIQAITPAGAAMTSTTQVGMDAVAVRSNLMNFSVCPGSPSGGGLPPVITSITPDNGIAQTAATTVVTIQGSNFGTSPGTVHFGSMVGPLASCGSWSDTQITVAAPAGLTGAPWVWVTTPGGNSNQVAFTVNSIIRPGICSINPTFGRAGMQVVITGRNFTDNRSPLVLPAGASKVTLACDPAELEPGCVANATEGPPAGGTTNRYLLLDASTISNWSNSQITIKLPPKVHTGPVRVNVDYGVANGGLRSSNDVTFRAAPYITSITSNQGPAGAWVTVRGGNFGACPARGVDVGDPCTVSFAGAGNSRVPEASLPAVCGASWTDSEVVVKVPGAVDNNDNQDVNKLVRVVSDAGLATAADTTDSKPFTRDDTQPPGPGLCALNPSTLTSTPFSNVQLVGDNFGTPPSPPNSNDKVSWPSGSSPKLSPPGGTAPTVSAWSNQSITVLPPVDTVSGDVTVQREVQVVTGRTCIGIQLGNSCLGLWQNVTSPRVLTSNPRVLTVNMTAGSTVRPQLLSVTPLTGSTNTCRNVAITATFNAVVSLAMVQPTDVTISPAVPGSLRVGGTSLAFVPDSALAPTTPYTLTLKSPSLGCGASDCLSNPATWSFTTGGTICTISHVSVVPAKYTFTDTTTPQDFTAHAFTADNQEVTAAFSWLAMDTKSILSFATSSGPTVSLRASGQNGQATLNVTADASAAFADPSVNPDATGNCPAGYSWYDRNNNKAKDAGECVRQGYLGTGSSSVEAYLCEAPWELDDAEFNFRLRYCRADTVKPGADRPLTNPSFGGAAAPSLAGWTVQGGSAWSTSPTGYQDATAAAVTQLWSSRLTQTVTNLQPNTTYVARARVLVDPAIPIGLGGGMIITPSTNCSSSYSLVDQASRASGWQQLQVVFDSGSRTDYTVCLFANANPIGASFSPAVRFDNVTVQEVSNNLPNFTQPAYTFGPGDPDIVREYFFSNPLNTDAIALRIYKNDQRLSPRAWYDARTDIIRGSPQSAAIDGYAAVKDGTSTYVAALNYDAPTVYSYVFVLTYNRGAMSDTVKVAEQLAAGWLFNTNLITADSQRRLQNDLARLTDRGLLKKDVEAYAAAHSHTVPQLTAGTYVRGLSVSRWDSWQQNLGSSVGATVPIDPVNAFCDVTSNPQCAATACPAGYDQSTCWNASAKLFTCPAGSHVYQYQAQGTSTARIMQNMEFKSVNWCGSQALVGGIVRCLSTDVAVGSGDACDSTSLNLDVGTPPLTVVPPSGGSVSSTDGTINCGSTCSYGYPGGSTVTLTATADGSHVFTGWTGDCTGTGSCTVTMLSNRIVQANFALVTTLTVVAPSNGTVTGPSINCGTTCSHTYAQGTIVTLTAVPNAGYVLSAWGGGCAGTPASSATCSVNIAGPTAVSVTFVAGAPLNVQVQGAGSGTVTSNPAGISGCSSSCSATFIVGSPVTLTVSPGSGSAFTVWGGACSSAGSNPTCIFTPSSTTPQSVTATFVPAVTVTVTPAGTGSGSVSSNPAGITCGATCSATFASGSSVTLTATPAADSVFTGWGAPCSGPGPCTLTNVTAATNVTATFNAVNFNLTVATTGNGTVTASPGGTSCGASCTTYPGGTNVTIIATASTGSIFSSWSGACSGTSPSCALTMDAAKSVTATFVTSASAASLTVTKLGGGSGTVTSAPAGVTCGATCVASFTSGTSLTLTATPAAGSVFTGWTGGGCTGTGTCSVTLSSNITVSATFLVSYALNIVPVGTGSGSVTSNPSGITCGATCSSTFASGSSVTLTATPSAGSVFTGWTGGGCSGTGTCTVTMSADTSVTATFTAGYSLTVTPVGTGSGTVTSNPSGITCGATCSSTFASGSSVTLTATPSAGSVFTGWTGGGCTGTGTCTAVMSSARTITTTFTRAYVLTVTRGGTGSGTVTTSDLSINCGSSCSASYAENSSITLTAVPSLGSQVTSWSYVGCTGTSCTVTMSAARTVNVVFDIITHNVVVARIGSGTVRSNPAGLNCGTTCTAAFPDSQPVTLTATPAAGYIFTGWGDDCTGVGLSCSLTVDADKNVTANFELARTLGVTITGGGTGSVGSNPAGISCSTGGPCPAASYVSGTTVVLTASAQTGSVFSSWSGDCASFGTSPTCTLVLSVNRTVGAVFVVAPSYSLNVSLVGSGQVTSFPGGITCGTTCSASYLGGTNVTLTAAAAAGYTFSGWSGVAGCSGTGTCTVSMTASRSVTATFTVLPSAHTVSVSMTGLGGITSSPAGILCGSSCSASFVDGTDVTLTASALPGYIFSSWSGDCTSFGASPTCTLAALSADQTAVANFVVGSSYTVRVTKTGTGSGTVSSAPAGIDCGVACVASYASTTPSVTLTATPSAGYGFAGWSGDCTGTATMCTVTSGADRNVTAAFEPLYTVTVTKAGAGASLSRVDSVPSGISCGGTCSASFIGTTSLMLTATPAAGYAFVNWSGDACSGSTSPSCTFTVDAAKSLTANFVMAPVSLSVTVNGSGTVTLSPVPLSGSSTCSSGTCIATYNSGTAVTLTATPGAGYTFVNWNGNFTCNNGNTNPVCGFTIVGAANTTATFGAIRTLTVTVSGSGGTVTVPPSSLDPGCSTTTTCTVRYADGTSVTLTTTTNVGVVLWNWSGDCSGSRASCTLTINADKSATANFAPGYALTVTRSGTGTGTVSGTGISCPSDCYEPYAPGAVVTLTASAGANSSFIDWSGSCSGSGTCTVTMNATRTVNAQFNQITSGN